MQQTSIEILRSSVGGRRTLFETVAAHLETQAPNIERDPTSAAVLDFLFNERGGDPIGLQFKGGTSLSKVYGLIRPFSEDMDIGIYKADLHVPLEADIAALPAVNQQQRAGADLLGEVADPACNDGADRKAASRCQSGAVRARLKRYSLHEYYAHQIRTHSDYGVAWASMRELADACRQHKQLMYRALDHRYDRAVPGSYRLIPTEYM